MNYRVMVVDDSRVVVAELEKILVGTEFEIVHFCRSGEDALSDYSRIQPDLVTMDIVMPGMDGQQAARELLERWPDARVLMASSLAYDDTIQMAGQIGTKGFLFKPFDRRLVIETMRSAMA